MIQTAKCALWFSSQETIKITPSHSSCRPLLPSPFLFWLSHYHFYYTPHSLIQTTNSKNKTQRLKKMYPKEKVRPEQDEDDSGLVQFLESFSSQAN
ncbi:hypothetical protein SLEP1_g36429 [Rubroshorea leprosula]|uniref:Uncharacterized protein n=1 Tax=Rubroshorea leprosula TaxID=152421 RepID=A0AAV5KS15_9ROSI|nr:hypothetical protein SLEP1_g36429 [Rubroshorea leprosula]